MRRTVVMGAIAASVVWACAPPMSSMVGDAMIDMGETLRDADSDASAQMVYDGIPCAEHVVYDYTAESSGGDFSQRLATWSAEAAVDLSSASVVRAFGVVCGPIRPESASLCPPSATRCTGDYLNDQYADELECQTVDVSFGDGVVRAYCGSSSRTTSTSSDGTVTTNEVVYRWTTARIVVETR